MMNPVAAPADAVATTVENNKNIVRMAQASQYMTSSFLDAFDSCIEIECHKAMRVDLHGSLPI